MNIIISSQMTLHLLDDRYKVNIGDEVRVNAEAGAADNRPRGGRIFGTVGRDLSKAGSNIDEFLVEFDDAPPRRVKKSDLRPSFESKQIKHAMFLNNLAAHERGVEDQISEFLQEEDGYMQAAQRHIANIVISLFKWCDEFEIKMFSLFPRGERNLDARRIAEHEVCHLFRVMLKNIRYRFAKAEEQQFAFEAGDEWRVLQNVDELFTYMLEHSRVLFQVVPHTFTTEHMREFMGHFLLWCESRQEAWATGPAARRGVWTRGNHILNTFDPPTLSQQFNGSLTRLGYMRSSVKKFKQLDIIANLVKDSV